MSEQPGRPCGTHRKQSHGHIHASLCLVLYNAAVLQGRHRTEPPATSEAVKSKGFPLHCFHVKHTVENGLMNDKELLGLTEIFYHENA